MQWWGCENRTARQALATVAVLLALVVEPSLPFTLVRSLEPRPARSAAGEHAGDAASVHGKLGGGDNGGGHSRAIAGHPPPPPLPPPRGSRRRQEQEGRGAASGEGFPTPDSTDGPATPRRPQAQAAGAEWRRPNRRGSYRLPTVNRRLGKTRLSESRSGQSREPDTEDSFNRRAGGQTALGESNRQQQLSRGVAAGRSGASSNNSSNGGGGGGQSRGGGGNGARRQSLHKHQALPGSVRDDSLRSGGSDSSHLTQVVQVDLSGHVAQDRSSSSVGSGGGVGIGSRNSAPDVGSYSYRHDSSRSPSSGAHGSDVLLSVVVVDPGKAVRLRVGRSEALQQQVHHPADLHTHVPKMVLTVVGSVTAILGVCVMAAIFQCCCRRKRSGSSGSEEEEEESSLKKEKVKERKGSGSRSRSSRSKSPSPQKVAIAKEGEETEKGQSEQDKLLEEDEDLGDFSVVQRETEILRSYRKPPPPKNRARQSRVPRALKTVEPNASPNVFQELAESDEPDAKKSKRDNAKTAKPANGVTIEKDMHSSMLADIDNTLAALHSKDDNETSNSDPFPSTNVSRSREPSVEKALAVKPDSDSSRLKPPSSKEEVPSSPSREELARVLAQELSRSVSKEALAKPLSKTASPKTQSKETTPKSSSASASPKLRSKDSSASENKDNVCSGNGSSSGGSDKAEMSPEEGDRKEPGNIFALIDPTIKDKETEVEDKSRSKIPVRAASSPTQPTAPLRQSLGKEKRFPVPSVHGEQMDQLLKSLKTRLKEDGSSPKRNSNKVSPEEDSTNDGLEPQARDRSHSDPSKQKEEKREKYHQTQL